MRTLDDLFCGLGWGALAVLAATQFLAGCGAPEPATLGLHAPPLPDVDLALFVVAPPGVEPEPAVQVRDPRVQGRCEPLDQPFCEGHNDCTDGTRCVRPWWAAADTTAMVCAMPMPGRAIQRWMAKRLRVYVDHVCRRSNGCEPNLLAKYLGVLIDRESTWQPGDRHRLNPDLEGASEALDERRHIFAGNPALDNPERWMTGLGYFAQNPAIWLPLWDPMADPESLCHEVVSTEVHLRGARAAVAKLHGGVDCDGDGEDDFWGTSCEPDGWADPWPHGERRLVSECSPSWYDMSRVNSGSLCPGNAEHRRRFEVRARRAGLDPWGTVDASDIGKSIPRDGQDEIAASIRVEMDALPR